MRKIISQFQGQMIVADNVNIKNSNNWSFKDTQKVHQILSQFTENAMQKLFKVMQ